MKSSRAPSKAGSGARPARPGGRAAGPGGRAAAGAGASAALDLLARFDRDHFPASLYVEGPDEALKAALLAELRAAWASAVPDASLARIFRAAESSVEEILAAFQGVSLFAARELSIVLEVEDLGRSEKRVAALAEGISRPAGASCLVLVESAAEQPRKSLDALRAASGARWIALPSSRPELLAWGTRRLLRGRVEAEGGVLEVVADACEGEALAFVNELDKLAGFVGRGGRLTREDAEALLRPALDADVPGYLGAIALGYPGLAAQKLGRLLAAGVSEGTLLFALTNLVGGALGGWARHRELSLALGRRLPPASLAAAMDALYRAESAWKGGRADPIAVLEQATRAVAGAR